MGRPLIEIDEKLCTKVENLAAQGLTVEQIAGTLGMGERTFYEKQAAYPQFSQAITAGRAKGVATVTNALFVKCKAGDTVAIKYYLNNRDSDEWRDRRHYEHGGEGGGPIDLRWSVEVVESDHAD